MSFHLVQNRIFHDPKGWKMRAEKAKQKIAAQRDPYTMALRRVRNLMNLPMEEEVRVREEWAQAQQLVPSPIPSVLHPHAVALLMTFLDREGLAPDDLTKPMREERDALERAVAEAVSAARADQAQAQADLDRLIAQRAAYDAMLDTDYTAIEVPETPVPADTAATVDLDDEDVPAAPEPAVAQVATALDHVGHVDVETDESVPVYPTRRGPGRPPKASV